MRIRDVQMRAYTTAKLKGWHRAPSTPLEIHMLIVSEISEATEAVRSGDTGYKLVLCSELGVLKPEGEPVELADAIIRILDYAQRQGWDMEQIISQKMEYNDKRSWRHGGKVI